MRIYTIYYDILFRFDKIFIISILTYINFFFSMYSATDELLRNFQTLNIKRQIIHIHFFHDFHAFITISSFSKERERERARIARRTNEWRKQLLKMHRITLHDKHAEKVARSFSTVPSQPLRRISWALLILNRVDLRKPSGMSLMHAPVISILRNFREYNFLSWPLSLRLVIW